MPIRLGSSPITDIRLGAAPVQAVRLGSQLVWSRSGGALRDDFATDGPLFGANWVDYGPAVDPNRAVVQNGAVRINLIDDIYASSLYVSQGRYALAQTPGDDGYLEVGIGEGGDPDPAYYTDVFRRMSNAAFTHGVGMRFIASTVRIVCKIGGVDTTPANAGSYGPGDKLRLVQSGNTHLVLRNGTDVGAWADDGATAAKGAGFRSIGLRVCGQKTVFWYFPARRYSASLDYIEAG